MNIIDLTGNSNNNNDKGKRRRPRSNNTNNIINLTAYNNEKRPKKRQRAPTKKRSLKRASQNLTTPQMADTSRPSGSHESPNLKLTLYEGNKIPNLYPMTSLCRDVDDVKHGVTNEFVQETLDGLTGSNFAIVAKRGTHPIGFIVCTIHNRYNVAVPRQNIISVDLLCSQLKGVGSVLIKEMERYARQSLCATLVVLDSVIHPKTVGFYVRNGYIRALDACNNPGSAIQTSRNAYTRLGRVENHFIDMNETNVQWMKAAMNGIHLQPFNNFEGTVFFSKCLDAPIMNHGQCRVHYKDRDVGTFLEPKQQVLARYKLNNTRWVRMQAFRTNF